MIHHLAKVAEHLVKSSDYLLIQLLTVRRVNGMHVGIRIAQHLSNREVIRIVAVGNSLGLVDCPWVPLSDADHTLKHILGQNGHCLPLPNQDTFLENRFFDGDSKTARIGIDTGCFGIESNSIEPVDVFAIRGADWRNHTGNFPQLRTQVLRIADPHIIQFI